MDGSMIDGIMADAGMKLKREYPHMEFFFVLIPYEKKMFAHLSAEEKRRMENVVTSSATKAMADFLPKNPSSGESR